LEESTIGNTGNDFGGEDGQSRVAAPRMRDEFAYQRWKAPRSPSVIPDQQNVRSYTGFQPGNQLKIFSKCLPKSNFN
jgi:hypothetical protein